ncbi:hypothetical protein [Stenotrophomonas maltophilia]|uniref:hypothetical protein n=1 Tax=Stenotrophomonas maltophilia TaxID=40324 RepID=UPI0013DA1741|nr:hypothetical protein [Stenotrophomonas maltophilia]MBC8772340.1 hypothetical protein [Stenotrophomonas maltophilia]MBH1591425.1 hypothetical protein [Stenotrophomonas maltophilia]
MNPLLRDELAALIADEMRRPEERRKESATRRDAMLRRIIDLQTLYQLGWLVRQETMHVYGVLECLSDEELDGLIATLLRAEQAVHDGVPFVEVGLIKGATCNWVA